MSIAIIFTENREKSHMRDYLTNEIRTVSPSLEQDKTKMLTPWKKLSNGPTHTSTLQPSTTVQRYGPN